MSQKWVDGLRRNGSQDGKLRFEARIVARNPETGEKVVDTVRTILADDKADALNQRKQLAKDLVDEKLGRVGKATRIKFCDAIDGWYATVQRYGSRKTYGTHRKHLKKQFGPRWLDSIEIDEMQRHLAAMAKKFAPSVVGGHKTVLINVYEWAADEGHVKRPNPATQLRVRSAKKKVAVDTEIADPEKKGMTCRIGTLSPDAVPESRTKACCGTRCRSLRHERPIGPAPKRYQRVLCPSALVRA